MNISFFLVHLCLANRFISDFGNNLGLALVDKALLATILPSYAHHFCPVSLYLVPLQVSRRSSLNSTSRTFVGSACTCGQGTKQAASLHITRCTSPLSWPDYPCPGGRPHHRWIAESRIRGRRGLSDTASYTARPGLGSLSGWSPAGRRRGRRRVNVAM